MFSRRSSMALPASPGDKDKKRRFSFFRSKSPEPIVTVPDRETQEVAPLSPTLSSSTNETNEGPDSQHRRCSVTLSEYSTSTSNRVSFSSNRTSFSFNRPTSSLGQVLEIAAPAVETSPDGLPTYASVMSPSMPATYSFTRSSPFAMVLTPDMAADTPVHEHGLYHISVNVNVWMPSSTVTTVRRGPSEAGLVVASLELGMSSAPATVTIGNVCKYLNQLYFRKSTMSRSRLYLTSEGAIKWKLISPSWQAYLNSTLLATFSPDAPYRLTVQPRGHPLLDYLIVSLVILMREHLTPTAGIKGDLAPLFNYSTHHNFHED